MITTNSTNKYFIESIILLLLLLVVLVATFEVVKAFFGIFTFALIFAVSFSKPYEHLVKLLKGRRKLAAIIYVVLVLSIVTLPFIYMASAISHHVRDAIHFVNDMKHNQLPPLPDWIKQLPFVGEKVDYFWKNIIVNPQQTITPYEVQIKKTLQHLLSTGTGMLGATFQFLGGILISTILLINGQKMLLPIKAAMKHLLGAKQGIELLNAGGTAIKGVSIGVMGTAVIAAFICWIGFEIAGIPFALVLAAIVFFLVLIQVGPLPVWIPVIIWYSTLGNTGMTIFLVIYAVLMMIAEAILKPVLIAKSGGKLPFLVLFVGVIGGMFAWGFTGMFKGAIVMAIFYTIFTSWLQRRKSEQEHLLDSASESDLG